MVPEVVAVTLTETMHVASGAMVAALKLTEPLPSAAVAAPSLQAPVMLSPLGVATTSPDGSALVNVTLCDGKPAGSVAVIVYVSVVVPPTEIEDGLNDISSVAGWADAAVADRATETSAAANRPNPRDKRTKRDTIFPQRKQRPA